MSHVFFFFNDTATTEIYTLSLHDALPISLVPPLPIGPKPPQAQAAALLVELTTRQGRPRRRDRLQIADRKSTRLNSSHANISYAVFCLKKKKKQTSRHYTISYAFYSFPST